MAKQKYASYKSFHADVFSQQLTLIHMEDINRMLAENEERMKRMQALEDQGVSNIHKHFDRIHDQLVGFNNMLIAGVFTLSQIFPNVPAGNVLWPIGNLAFMILLEYRMMEHNRILASITTVSEQQRDKYGKGIEKTNRYSLLMILSTALVTAVFFGLLYTGIKAP